MCWQSSLSLVTLSFRVDLRANGARLLSGILVGKAWIKTGAKDVILLNLVQQRHESFELLSSLPGLVA